MNRTHDQTALALLVRVPVPGRVKTRLAASLGDQNACSLYLAMVSDILTGISTSGLPLHLFYDGAEARLLPPAWVQCASRVCCQCDGDIGARMAQAFALCFAAGFDRVLLAGSDIPGMDGQTFTAAAEALVASDAVINPTVDGGYCLIGLQRSSYHLSFFQDMAWSSDQVLHTTLERMQASGLEVCQLPVLRDIDTADDLKAYLRHPSPAARATNTLLRQWGYNPSCP